jgi:hypothetical protein
MLGNSRIRLLVPLLAGFALAACGGSKEDKGDDDDKTKSEGAGKVDPSTNPIKPGPEPKAKTVFSYPPSGAGPHEGFDLNAIRDKLQGAWLVGGSAFSSIPNVWYLDGDTLVRITEGGERSESTLRLLAPCYYFEGTKDGGSGTYGHFAFDGNTLYLGLGNSGLVSGAKTIGCMSVAMYVHENGSCTSWTKKPFGREGDFWEKEAGDCGYTDDKSEFYGDDTNSKRKTYGRQSLNVRGDVLLTKQMEGNKAERFDTLAAALAEQKKRVDAKDALKKTPTDLPFSSWGVDSSDPGWAKGDAVWAAGASRKGKWSLGAFRYEKFENGAVWVRSGNDAWAPSAFAHASPGAAKLKKGDPALLAIGALMPYGRFVKMDGDKVVVAYKSARKVKEKTMDAKRIMPLEANKWVFAAPVAYKKGDLWTDGRLVLDAADGAYVFTGDAVEKLAKADIKLVDVSKKWKKGATVWAMEPSGMAPRKFVEGTITEVHGDGIYYTIKAANKTFDQTFARLVDAL